MKIRSSSVPKAGGKNLRAADKQVKTMTASHLSAEKINDVLTRVRELAWKGQHTQAIELATQELSRSEWHSDPSKADYQSALLDLRAESYIAQGKLHLAAKDADAMMKLVSRTASPAKKSKSGYQPDLQAKALNRKALVKMRMGDSKAAVKSATQAVNLSKSDWQSDLHAQSLLVLSEAQMRAWQSEAAIESGQKAIALFQELGDKSGTGRAYWSVGFALFDLRRMEEAQPAMRISLELCQQAGDQYGIGNAHNALSTMNADFAEILRHLQQAQQAFESAGYAERQVGTVGNLANTYIELGLYPHSLRLSKQAIEMARSMGAKGFLANVLNNLSFVEIVLGKFDSARLHLMEVEKLVPDLGDPNQDSSLAQNSGDLAFAEGDFKTAILHYKAAVKIAHQAQLASENLFLTDLGKAYLANQEPTAALKATTKATDKHRAQSFAKPDGTPSQGIWWRHAQALIANKKTKEAREALDRAYDFLLESIQNIRDVGLRRNYFNKVEVNRELIQFWVRDGAGRKLPKDRLFAYLNIESNIREPFKRLTDTSLRLNALKTVSEIQTFLVEEVTELSGGERVMLILEKDGKTFVAESLLPRGEKPEKVLASITKHLAQARLSRAVQLILPSNRQSKIANQKSRIVAPLIAQNQILGYLYADMDSLYGTFDETDRDMLGMLANQAAVTLDNVRWAQGLEQKVEQRTEELSARVHELAIVNSISQAMAQRLDMEGIIRTVGDKVRDIFNAEVTEILLLNESSNMIYSPYSYYRGYQQFEPFPFGEGLTSRIIRTRAPLQRNNEEEGIALGAIAQTEEDKTESYIGVPIVAGDKALGVVSVQSYQPYAFTDNHVRLLSTLAANMGVALENARLFDETQRRAQEIATMAEITREISASLDLSTVLKRIASRAMEFLRARDVVLRLVEPDGRLPAAVAIGKYADIYKKWDAQVGRGLSGSVTKSGIAEIINDPENDPRVIDIAGTEEDKATRAILFAPLFIGESAIGVLSVWRDKVEVGPFTQTDLDFTVSLARQAAIAIQNARLFAETQQRFKETEILRAANVALTKSFDLDSILGTLLDYLQQIVPYDTGSVFLLESDTHLTARAARGYEQWIQSPEQAIGISFEFKSLPHIRSVVEEQFSLIIPDVNEHSHWIVAPTAKHVRNWLAVPLVAGGKTIGMYSLDKAQPGFFTPEHQRLADNLAAQAAIAIQNATLYRNQLAAREQAETLQSVTQALSRTLSLQEVFDLILTELQKVVPYDSCSVQQLDGEYVTIVGGHGFFNLNELLGLRFKINSGDLSWNVLNTRQSHIVEDVSASFPHFKNREHGAGRIHGWMGIPLIFGDRLLGMLALDKHEKAFYTPEHAQLAMAFAAQAAVAIENARLFETERAARQQAESQSRQMATLNRVAASLTATLDLHVVLESVARELVDLLNARSVGIGLLNRDKSAIRVESYYSRSDEPSAVGLMIPVEGNIATRQVIETGQPVLISDAQNTPLQDEATRSVMRARNTQCILILPLLSRGEVIGTIGPDTDQPGHVFTAEEIQLAQTVTSQLAGAIENARLFDETQRLLEETRKAKEAAETLRAANLALTQNLNLDAICEELLTLLFQVAPYDSASIFLLESNSRLVAHATRGYEMWMKDPVPAQTVAFDILPGTVMHHVVSGKSYLIPDTRQAEDWEAIPGEEFILSWLGVPMMIGDQIIGVISLDKNQLNFFTEEMVKLATSLGAQAAFAIQNARLFDETQRTSQEMATMAEIGREISATIDLSIVLQRIAIHARDLLQARIVHIFLYKDQELSFGAALESDGARDTTWTKPRPNGLTFSVAQGGETIIIEDMHNHPLYRSAPKDGGGSIISIPLKVGDTVVGVLNLSRSTTGGFSPSELRLLSLLSDQAAVAISNARLFDETQRLLKETEQRNAELAIVNSISQAMAQRLDMDGIIHTVGDKVRDIFNAEVTEILLLDESTNMIHAVYSYYRGYQQFEPFEFGEGITSRIIRTRLPLKHGTLEEAVALGALFLSEEDKTESYIGVPIVSGDKALGVISVQSYKQYAFDENHVRLLSTLASNMGVALENARLFDETQRLLKESEQRAAELAFINSVQEGLVARMDIQGIYDLVGNKIRDISDAQVVMISLYDDKEKVVHYPYAIERGERLLIESGPLMGFRKHVIETRQYLLINKNLSEEAARYGNPLAIKGEVPRSVLFVPMIIGTEAKGVISLQNLDRENAFSASDVRLLQTLANSMSVALENARLFDETQRLLKESEQRAAELSAISRVSQALVAETELDSTIQLIGRQTREIFDADIVYVALLDPQTNLIHFPYQIGESFTTLNVREGHTGRIIQTGEALLINKDVGERSRELGVSQVGRDALSYLGVPIKAGGETIGVISVQSTTQEGLFNDDSLRLLTTIASNAGAAIHTARLHNETQRNASQMATIASVGRELSATLDLQKVTQTVVENVHSLFQARDTILRLVDSDGNTLRTALALGFYAEENSADIVLLGQGITGSIAQSGIAEVIGNVDLDPRGVHIPGTPDLEEVPETMMVAPLIAGSRTIGVLSVYRDRAEGSFSLVDLDFLVGLGRQAAIAIENSRLFNETQSLLKQTEQRATELQIINNIGQTLTEELDLNTMIQHIGDKLREAFKVGNIRIAVVDEKTGLLVSPYVYRHGRRVAFEENWQDKSARYKLAMRASARKGFRSWVVNTNAEKSWRKFAIVTDEEDIPKSFVMLPLLAGKEVIGGISIPDYEKENAFNDLSVGMLETIASNMGTAIQNARLFEETKRLFKDAQEARAAAEQANKAKSTFLANMSHELRTPLNAIIGFTRIVRRKSEAVLPEKQIENLDKVLSSSEHLLGLINTVLDIAKIEAGRMDVIPGKFNMSSLVDQCANLATPLLKPNVRLEKQVDETIGIIFSDQDKIKQIVLNLLSNAAKFTHDGMILLSVQKQNEDIVNISVTDSGIGISEEALGRIFEEFQQADTSTTREYGGTGLGLAISRNLARLLGGDLTATSKLGEGSTFTLTVPTYYGRKPAPQADEKPFDHGFASQDKPASGQDVDQQPTRDAAKHRILVIDDDPDALYLLQEALGTSEFDVVGARNGHTGLQIARDQQPEAILLDILMPETDGWQILNDLKSEARTANIPVILLTIVDKKALGFKLGAADYLLKPLNPAAVLDTLRRVIGEKGHLRKCALVVDDDPHVAEMLRQTLPESEFALISAEDGEAGLQAIRTQRPDVILLDLVMPRLDGFGVIERLRANPELRNIPVIVISSKDLTQDESRRLRESVAFVMKKQGFDSGRLIQEINSVVKKQ